MGGFYGSVQLLTEDRDGVLAKLDTLAEQQQFQCLVSPVLNGWVGVYPSDGGQSDRVGRAIAEAIGGISWHVLVHDDSVLAYLLYRDGVLIDSYWSSPGYFGEEDRAEQEAMAGDPDLLAATVGGDADKLRALLDRTNDHVFEVERLIELGKLTGVKNLATAFEYLQAGETEGVTGAKKFIELPKSARQKKAAEKRARREQLRLLKKQGVLLHNEKINAYDFLCACATPNGFLSFHSGIEQGPTVRVVRYQLPNLSPEVLSWGIAGQVMSIAGGVLAQRVAVCLGDRVDVRDMESGQILCQIPAVDWTPNVYADPNVDTLATVGRPGLRIVGAGDGEVRMSEKFNEQLEVAVHLSGEWIATGGKDLKFTRVEKTSNWQQIPVSIHTVRPDYGAVLTDQLTEMRTRIEELVRQYPHINSFEPIPHLSSVGFSRDGNWLWCGAAMGVWVYRWNDLLESDKAAFAQWWHPTTPWLGLEYVENRVCSITEAADGNSIYFGTSQGHLNQLQLTTGTVRKVFSFPEGLPVRLTASVDGTCLAALILRGSREGEHEFSTSWQIWNSLALDRMAP